MSADPLLKVRDLGVTFRTGDRVTVASTEVSFDLAAGEVLAVVGESGSGKSVSALALTRLLPPAQAGLTKDKERELNDAIQGYFKEWLVQANLLRQVKSTANRVQ